MPRLSLTDFVDIVSASGTPKATKVRQVKERPEYEPAFDYYKQVREGLVACHRTGDPRGRLEYHVGEIRDAKKIENYATIVSGYRRWWGKKVVEWFEPPYELFCRYGVDVAVNPEVGAQDQW